MQQDRRQFLHWCSLASGALAVNSIACGTDSGGTADAGPRGADATPKTDGAPQCPATTADVIGPFFEAGAPMRAKIAADDEPGDRLNIDGVVRADDCTTPVAGALIDVWQADKDGNYHDANTEYRLRGQVLTDNEGRFQVQTIRPGNYLIGTDAWRPAHLHFTFNKPGYAGLTTQLYFQGDPFLPPNDACTTCGSNDPERIIPLTGDNALGFVGQFDVILARA